MNQEIKDNYLDKLIASVYPVHSEYTFYCSVDIERTCKISEVQAATRTVCPNVLRLKCLQEVNLSGFNN